MLCAAYFAAPAGSVLLVVADAGDISRRYAQGFHALGLQNNLHFALHPAYALDEPHARDIEQFFVYGIVCIPTELLLGPTAIGCELQGIDRKCAAYRVFLGDDGLADFYGQVRAYQRYRIAHFRDGVGHVFFKQKLGCDHDLAIGNGGHDFVYACNGRDGVFEFACNLVFKLRGRCAWLRHNDCDYRHVHVGQLLHGCHLEQKSACHAQQRKNQNRWYGFANGVRRYVHAMLRLKLLASAAAGGFG